MKFVRPTAKIAAALFFSTALVGVIPGTANATDSFRISFGLSSDHTMDFCATPYGGHTTNGTKLTVWPCNGDSSQSWHYVKTSWGSLIVNNKGGRCLTPSGGGTTNGTYLTLWDCDSNEISQKWGKYSGYLQNLHSGKYVTPYGGSLHPGTYLTIWSANDVMFDEMD